VAEGDVPEQVSPVTVDPPEAQERERIQQVLGAIGGKPRLKGRILNALFVVAVLAAFATSLLTHGIPRIISIDEGVLLLSLKLAYHLHTEARVNHAQFWILTTIEDRLLNIISELRGLRREFREFSSFSEPNPSEETDAHEDPTSEPGE
jgi:hypothetical protein